MRYLALVSLIFMPALALGQPKEEAAQPLAQTVLKSWADVKPDDVAKLLEAKLNDETHAVGKQLSVELSVLKNNVTVKKDEKPGQVPYLIITFDAAAENAAKPKLKQLATDFVEKVLVPRFSEEFKKSIESSNNWAKVDFNSIEAQTEPDRPKSMEPNPFDIPEDLSTPHKILLFKLGYLASSDSSLSVAFTPAICQEMAISAIRYGLYRDAIALANHGLKYHPVSDPAFLYLRGYCEIGLGPREDATKTIKELKSAGRIPTWLMERVNGPAAVYLFQAYSVF